MDVAVTQASVRAVQGAFEVISLLNLTAFTFPPHTDVPDGATYDYIICGGGTAGSIIANRLTENPNIKVLLIEAGEDPRAETVFPALFPYLVNTKYDWNFIAEDDLYSAQYRPYPRMVLPAGKTLGGSSSIQHMFYIRGDPCVYDEWVKITGDPSWSWDNLLPYFKKSERLEDFAIANSETGVYHGFDGPLGVSRNLNKKFDRYLNAFSELSYILLDFNAKFIRGYGIPLLTIAEGVRQGTANAYLSPMKYHPNLHVMKNSLVTKVLFDNNKNAIGVEIKTKDGNLIKIKASIEVILSAGAFNTPKILMLSGIGPQKQLESFGIPIISHLPVGENFQDHVSSVVLHLLEKTNEPVPPQDPGRYPLVTFIGLEALNRHQSFPDYLNLNAIVSNNPMVLTVICTIVFNLNVDICQKFYNSGKEREVLLSILSLSHPKSRGRVSLRSTNPEDNPEIYTGYLSDKDDLEKQAACVEDLTRIVNTTEFRKVAAETLYLDLPNCKYPYGSREYWKCYILDTMTTTFHYCGTAPMGTVLDARLRVRGVQRLRVIDASSMPKITSGNIMPSVMVIAEKGADMIKEEWEHASLGSYVPYCC